MSYQPAIVAAFAAAIVLLSACGDDDEGPPPTATATAEVTTSPTATPTATPTPSGQPQLTVRDVFQPLPSLGLLVEFDATDPDGDVVEIVLDWGDDSEPTRLGPDTIVLAEDGFFRQGRPGGYERAGRYEITITITDDAGQSVTETVSGTVEKNPTVVQIPRADGCDSSTNLDGNNLLRQVAADCDLKPAREGLGSRLRATAAISGGVFESPQVTSRMWANWNGPGEYRLDFVAYWRGFFGGAGLAGTGLESVLEVRITDGGTRTFAREVIHTETVLNTAITATGYIEESPPQGIPVQIDFTIPPSHTGLWRIEIWLTCEATSGLIGIDLFCAYDDSFLTGRDGYAEWRGALELTQFLGGR